MKSISFIARRPDIPLADFVDYYEDQHAPLASRLLDFMGYRRNHAVSDEPLGFATIGEYWSDIQTIGAAMAGPAGDELRADELRFMDKRQNKAAIAEPVLVASLTGRLSALLISGEENLASLSDAIRQVGGELDLLSPFDDRPLPCRAVAFVPCGAQVALTGDWSVLARCTISRIGRGNVSG